MIQKAVPDSAINTVHVPNEITESPSDSAVLPDAVSPRSTLIKFPGRSRTMPEWRRQLSLRVREVQERKAREAAEETAAAVEAGTVSCALPSAQLELVPDVEQPTMNPIVSKALERLERARRVDSFSGGRHAAAAAPALAPIEEAPESALSLESKPKLTMVVSDLPESAVNRKPVRVITEEVEKTALSYLEACLEMPALVVDTRTDQAGFARRAIAGGIDILLTALMVSPLAAAIEFDNRSWTDPRVIGVMATVTVVTMFAYLTISTALTGRTLAMRILSIRTIDIRTGMIPTGGQAVKRAIGYIFSLSALGLGLLYAFIDSDGRTMHDRFSETIVVRDQKPEPDSLATLALN